MPIAVKPGLLAARTRMQSLGRSRSARRWARGILIFLVVFGMLGFFAAPPLIRSVAQNQLSRLLQRPVTITKISLNPYTLALEAEGVRILEREGSAEFASLSRLRVRPSWSSLLRGKPIIAAVLVDTLKVNVVRNSAQQFNFTDILETLTKPGDAPPRKPANPLLFSVSNIRVENTRIDFDDRLLAEHHRIEQLRIGIPFIANIPSQIEIFVQPLLEASIDGSPLSLTGQAKPFSPTLDSILALRFAGLDLKGLLAYSPTPLPVKVQKARLSTDLTVHFQRVDGQPSVSISGSFDLADLAITDTADQPLFEATLIHMAADTIDPLRQIAHLSELRIDHPRVSLSRDAKGVMNLSRLAPTPAPGEARPVITPAKQLKNARAGKDAAITPAGVAADQRPVAGLPDVSLRHLQIDEGLVHFDDRAVGSPASVLQLQAINLALDDFSTREAAPAKFDLKAHLEQGGDVTLDGTANVAERKLGATLGIAALPLSLAQPYLASLLNARLGDGRLNLQLQVSVDAKDPSAPAILIGPGELALQDLKLTATGMRSPSIALGLATAKIERIDLKARHAELASLVVERLSLTAERTADGRIDLASLVRPASGAAASATAVPIPKASKGKAAPPASWTYRLGSLALRQSNVSFADASNAQPVKLQVSDLALTLGAISEDARKTIPIELSATLQRKGKLSASGTLVREPLQAALALKGSELDIAALAPYFMSGINASLASAQLGLSGAARFAMGHDQPLTAGYKGDARLVNVRVLDRESSDAFLGWGELNLTGINARYGDPGGPDVDIGRILLGRFFAQVLLDTQGRLNIGRVIATPPTGTGKADADTPLVRVETIARIDPAGGTSSASSSAAATAPVASTPPLKLRVGEIVFAQGAVDYTDNFIKPNFTANLTDIGGSIGTFGTATAASAPVDIKARLNANGPVEISGSINPLAVVPSLDITASAREIELTRFAAYSTKYTGYPIIKGKLQVDLGYKLEDNKLKANNHIFIDQFTFGDRVESASATSLPVRLAISLLKNSRGEIDINVPVSGSLSDPKFSVGGVIWSAFVNLIEKAITSPFSLLASAFGGGGEELGSIDFAPGSAVLDEAQKAKLDKIAKALADKPAIKLDLGGHADAALDTPALKQANLARQIQQQKLKDVVGKGESIDVDAVVVETADYDKYLSRAYSASSIKKPRNALGLAKTLPADEMKTLLADAVPVGDGELLALADRRAAAVQQWLDGKVNAGRVFVVAARLAAAPAKDAGKTTRVDFTLRD